MFYRRLKRDWLDDRHIVRRRGVKWLFAWISIQYVRHWVWRALASMGALAGIFDGGYPDVHELWGFNLLVRAIASGIRSADCNDLLKVLAFARSGSGRWHEVMLGESGYGREGASGVCSAPSHEWAYSVKRPRLITRYQSYGSH